jgi:hypothetical protein
MLTIEGWADKQPTMGGGAVPVVAPMIIRSACCAWRTNRRIGSVA